MFLLEPYGSVIDTVQRLDIMILKLTTFNRHKDHYNYILILSLSCNYVWF